MLEHLRGSQTTPDEESSGDTDGDRGGAAFARRRVRAAGADLVGHVAHAPLGAHVRECELRERRVRDALDECEAFTIRQTRGEARGDHLRHGAVSA